MGAAYEFDVNWIYNLDTAPRLLSLFVTYPLVIKGGNGKSAIHIIINYYYYGYYYTYIYICMVLLGNIIYNFFWGGFPKIGIPNHPALGVPAAPWTLAPLRRCATWGRIPLANSWSPNTGSPQPGETKDQVEATWKMEKNGWKNGKLMGLEAGFNILYNLIGKVRKVLQGTRLELKKWNKDTSENGCRTSLGLKNFQMVNETHPDLSFSQLGHLNRRRPLSNNFTIQEARLKNIFGITVAQKVSTPTSCLTHWERWPFVPFFPDDLVHQIPALCCHINNICLSCW